MTKLSFLFTGLLLAGCSTEPSEVRVSPGEWGGANIELQVSEMGGNALFKCGALGVLTAPLVLDRAGSFDVAGTYDPKLVLGGPRPARFRGTVSGRTMTLSLDVSDTVIGPYALTQGSMGTFDVCNF